METLELYARRAGDVGEATHRAEPQSHLSRRRSRSQIATAATTCLFSAAVGVLTTTLPTASASSGGFLVYPQSRNYIAYKSSSIKPSATHPASLLPEEEPVPQSLNSGQTCGVTDGGERDYNRPMSRSNSLLPLNIQEVYVSGSEIEVTVNTFGVEDGGHFEFHICALEYPQEPTEECFLKHPLTFVKDHYYGALKDEVYPERAYLPFEQVFKKNDSLLARVQSMARIESDEAGYRPMMEFKYTFKLPESRDLWMDFDALKQQQQNFDSGAPSISVQVPIARLDDKVKNQINDLKIKPFDGKILMSGSTGNDAALISAMVTDGRGTTTMVSMNEIPIIHENGPIVEATAICNFGDVAIYGEGMKTIPERIKRICGLIEQIPMVEALSPDNSDSVSSSNGDATNDLPAFPITKYAILRWHYQTARDCYPVGYDNYTWAEKWGQWQPPTDGECGASDSQDEYWNCAEVIILNSSERDDSNETDISYEPPNAIKDVYTVDANAQVLLDVLANDISPNEAELHVDSVTSPAHGFTRISEDAFSVIYVPDRDYIGLDSFEYRSCDRHDSCDDAQVDILVGPTMDLVFAKDDEAITIGTEPVFINVLKNDIVRVDNWPLFIVSTPQNGRHGNCTPTPGSWIVYEANPGYEGRDRCTYIACITNNICDKGSIFIDVKSAKELTAAMPASQIYNIVAVNDAAVTQVNRPITIDVLANDEINGNAKPKIKATNNSSANGNCEVLGNEILYVPKSDFIGWDRCGYSVCIGNAVCDEALIKIKVLDGVLTDSTTNTPVARPDSANVVEGSSVNMDALENDDGDFLEISTVSSPIHGSVKVVNNLIRYTSTAGFIGTDSFKYSVCDYLNRCDSAGVAVTITAEVFAENDSATTYSVPVLIDVTLNDRSSSGDTSLDVTNVSDGKHGSCSITASDKVKYVPDDGYTGLDRCNYIVCASNICDQGRIEINVLPPIEAMEEPLYLVDPEKVYAHDDHVEVTPDESVKVDVVSNDFVKGMGPLLLMHTGGSVNGKCEITIDNKILYIPKNGFRGSDKCDYIICHESNMCDEGILRVDVIQETEAVNGPIILRASADATITIDFPTTNSGNETVLFVSSASSEVGMRDVMLKFNTSSIDEPRCENGIDSATLSVYSIAFANDGGTLITTSKKNWDEMGVKWNNAPEGDGIVLYDLGSIEENRFYEVDVSSAVTLGEPLSIRIISHSEKESIALYASKEYEDESHHPVLRIRCKD